MDTLLSLRVFCTVAELKSFTAAGERLGLSTAMASKHVMALEGRLGARLLNRTSRRVSLTETGAVYSEQARHLLEGLDEAEAAVSWTAVTPRGKLRVSAPIWMANPAIAAVLADYRALYPEVTLDFDLTGRTVNLVEEGFDLALRVQSVVDPGLIACTLADIAFHLVASPAYLARVGHPKNLKDLDGRPYLAYSRVFADGTVPLVGPDGPRTVHFAPILQSGNETLLHMACVQGMGLTFLPLWMIAQDLAEGRLERVFPDTAKLDLRLLAVYPSRKHLSAKVRTFLDFLATDRRLKQSATPAAGMPAKTNPNASELATVPHNMSEQLSLP